jgi:hypothetical protein
MKDKLPDRTPSPWWRHPIMWLIVGGPLVVVVAGLVTASIAIRGADTVLPTQEATQTRSEAPAIQARNHAATPLPATKP